MGVRSSGMPSTAVYLVWPSLMALIAAALILSGVSKSGSPAPRPITSRPAAFSSRALLVTAMVGDGWMRPSDSARKPLGNGMEATLVKNGGRGITIAAHLGKTRVAQSRHAVRDSRGIAACYLGVLAAISPYCRDVSYARPAGTDGSAPGTARHRRPHRSVARQSEPTNSCRAMAVVPRPSPPSRQTGAARNRGLD